MKIKNSSSKFLISIFSAGIIFVPACSPNTTDINDVPETVFIENIDGSQPLEFGQQFQIASKVYGTDREINIYEPEIPEWGKDYFQFPLPILYVVDGGTEQDFFHIAALSQLTLLNAERQPMIVVGVRTHNRRQEITPDPTHLDYQIEFNGMGGSHIFREFLIEEVKPFVESRYAVERDAVIGESLAGLFIVETFLKAPDTFDDYISISPSLWWDDRKLAKEAGELLNKHILSDRRIYLTMADEGGTMQLGLDELLAALNASGKNQVKYVDRRNEDSHSTIYHHGARDALGWMYGITPRPYGEEPWYLKINGSRPTAEK